MANRSTFLPDALRIQIRVIKALILRELVTRFGRENIGFFWLFLENLMFTFAVLIFWISSNAKGVGHGDVVAFTVVGYSFVLAWRNIINRSIKAIEPNRTLMYHRQVKILDVLFSRIILEAVGVTGSLLFTWCIVYLFGFVSMPADVFLFLSGWLLTIFLSSAMALFIGLLSEISEIFERIWHILTYILFPLSAAFLPVNLLPDNVQTGILFIPLVHCIEMLRSGYYGVEYIARYDIYYLLCCTLFFFLIGLSLEKTVRRRMVGE